MYTYINVYIYIHIYVKSEEIAHVMAFANGNLE